MKVSKLLSTVLSTSALSLLLTTTALVYAQEQREDPKPAEEARPEAVRPAPDEMKSPKQDEAKPQKQEDQQQDRDKIQNNKEDNKSAAKDAAKEEKRDSKSAEQGRADANRGGGRIPDDKFRAHFGRQHTFKVQRSTIVGGQPRFQSGGYSFTLVDAWPAGWAYTDDCYVDYVDGEYFLFDVLHPGVRVALVVVL